MSLYAYFPIYLYINFRVLFNLSIDYKMQQRPIRQFLDPQKISKHLYCAICHEVFDDPSRVACGHTFCFACILWWKKMNPKCPLCKFALAKRWPEKDLIAAHIIDDLMAKCSHINCHWTGVYSVLKKHQRFCVFREKKVFDNPNLDNVVKLLDDQEEKKEETASNQSGRKKVKKNQKNNNLPQFQAQASIESLNIQPLQPVTKSLHIQPRSSQNQQKPQQNQFKKLSSSREGYLETNPVNLLKRIGPCQRKKRDHLKQIQCEQPCPNQEQKNQNDLSYDLGQISFHDDEDQINFSPKEDQKKQSATMRIDLNKKKEKQSRKRNEYQQDFFQFTDHKNDEPQNLYVYERYLQKEQMKKIQKMNQRWKNVHQNSVTSSSQNSNSSDMSNPFDDPIPQTSREHPAVKELIIIESSDESQLELARQKQSGQVSFQQNQQISNIDSIYSPHLELITDQINDDYERRSQIQAQLRILMECKPEKEFLERLKRRNQPKEESLQY